VFPKANPRDIAPNNEKGVDQELRAAQIRLPLAEVEEAYKEFTKICARGGAEIAKQNFRRKGFKGGSSRRLRECRLEAVEKPSFESSHHP
jgi:platelet-activating factor acetylhydrolase